MWGTAWSASACAAFSTHVPNRVPERVLLSSAAKPCSNADAEPCPARDQESLDSIEACGHQSCIGGARHRSGGRSRGEETAKMRAHVRACARACECTHNCQGLARLGRFWCISWLLHCQGYPQVFTMVQNIIHLTAIPSAVLEPAGCLQLTHLQTQSGQTWVHQQCNKWTSCKLMLMMSYKCIISACVPLA